MNRKKPESTILNGKYDFLFKGQYSRNVTESEKFKSRVLGITNGFNIEFPDNKREMKLYSSPGRLELIGNHTDHQGGRVLTGTVNAYILTCAAKTDSREITVFSEGYGRMVVSCDETDIKPEEKNKTSALIRGMVKAINDAGFTVGGFDMYAASDIPAGLGMSSSAAFEMLLGIVMNDLFCKGELTDEQIAYAGMYAEREYFGKPCGLMDQMACISGGINIFDFSDAKYPEKTPVEFDFEMAGFEIIVTDTGTNHADSAKDFNAIPAEMCRVANALGEERLCDINEADFYTGLPSIRKKVGDRALMRAIHWYGEVKRVELAGKALRDRDVRRFLELVRSSGESSFMYLQNVDNYKNPGYQPVALCLSLAGHLLGREGAVRLQGGGFAGSIIAYVPKEKSDEFVREMEKLVGTGACRRMGIV